MLTSLVMFRFVVVVVVVVVFIFSLVGGVIILPLRVLWTTDGAVELG